MIDRLPFTMALSTMLATATALPVGRGRKPAGAVPPYLLLYSITSTVSGAPFTDLSEDASFIYQVTGVSGPNPADPQVSGVADQAEWMGDKVRAAVLGRDPVTGLWLRPLTIPGAKVICRELDTEPGGTSDPSDAIMSYVQRFRFDLTAA